MAACGESLTGLWFDGQRYFGADSAAVFTENSLPVFQQADRWLDIYFRGKIPDFTPPISLKASVFRLQVWEILLTVPYGRTISYGEIAGRVAEKTGAARVSAQAVGGAVAHNPISLIIPCHRVIGADGSLTGYAGGISRKAALLRMEEAVTEGRYNAHLLTL
jgi:methylated-DNA-[protein]-cysteine S-methyltransferase